MSAVHNAGHAMGCIAHGRRFLSVTARTCRGNPLGLRRVPESFIWGVICWCGPAAEAVAATRCGASVQDAAEWIWALYRAACSGRAATGDLPGSGAADPGVLAVALAVADANWAGVESVAAELIAAAASRGRIPGL